MRNKIFSITVLALAFLAGKALIAADDSLVTAVYSNAASNYKREKLPDGSFKPGYYAISNGGFFPRIGRDHIR